MAKCAGGSYTLSLRNTGLRKDTGMVPVARLVTSLLLGFVFSDTVCARQYNFCVTQFYSGSTVISHVELRYGDVDPSREGARLIVAARMKDVGVNSVQVSNFDRASCRYKAESQMQVTATWDQVQRLGSQITSGNEADALITAGTIVAGGAVDIIKGVGGAIGKISLPKVPKIHIGPPKIHIDPPHIKPPHIDPPKLPHCDWHGCH